MNPTTINPEEQRKFLSTALEQKDYEQALHLISEVQEDGRFPLLAIAMSQRLELAEGRDAEAREQMEMDYEVWSNYQRDNAQPAI